MNNTFYPEYQYFLAHYGVLGMRWGHRKDQYYVGSKKRRRNRFPPVDKAYDQYKKQQIDYGQQKSYNNRPNSNNQKFDKGMQTLKYKNQNQNKTPEKDTTKDSKTESSNVDSEDSTEKKQKKFGLATTKRNRDSQYNINRQSERLRNRDLVSELKKTEKRKEYADQMLQRKNKEFWTQTDIKDLGKVAAEKREIQKTSKELEKSIFKQKAKLEARKAAATTAINAIPNLPVLQDNYIDLTYKGHPVASINTGDIVKFGLTSAYNIYQIVDNMNRYK